MDTKRIEGDWNVVIRRVGKVLESAGAPSGKWDDCLRQVATLKSLIHNIALCLLFQPSSSTRPVLQGLRFDRFQDYLSPRFDRFVLFS